MGLTSATTSKGHPGWVAADNNGSGTKANNLNRAISATTRVKGLIPTQQKLQDQNKNITIKKLPPNVYMLKTPNIKIYSQEQTTKL